MALYLLTDYPRGMESVTIFPAFVTIFLSPFCPRCFWLVGGEKAVCLGGFLGGELGQQGGPVGCGFVRVRVTMACPHGAETPL
jgi:hypothetical protein